MKRCCQRNYAYSLSLQFWLCHLQRIHFCVVRSIQINKGVLFSAHMRILWTLYHLCGGIYTALGRYTLLPS